MKRFEIRIKMNFPNNCRFPKKVLKKNGQFTVKFKGEVDENKNFSDKFPEKPDSVIIF